MAKLKKFLGRIRLIYRPSQTSIKVVVILTLLLCTISLIALRISTNNLKEKNDALHSKAEDMSAVNDELKEDISQIGSAEGAVEFAQDELGYVDPNTIIYEPEN